MNMLWFKQPQEVRILTESHDEDMEKDKKTPFLRKLFLVEAEKTELPSVELFPIILKKIRNFFIDK